MADTALTIIERGLALSAMNRPETLATNGSELLRVVNRALVAVFAFCARVNPGLLAAQVDVLHNGTSWTRPDVADMVFRIEGRGAATTPTIAVGTEVKVVPQDDLTVATPAVYRFGQQYYSAGKSGDPTAGTLRFFCAGRPAELTATSDTIDARFPSVYYPILEYEVGTYCAMKDGGRPQDTGASEQQMMAAERDRWLSLFNDWCEHETAHEVRRFDEVKRFNTEAREKVKQALTPAA
jgi:hypothetical protein